MITFEKVTVENESVVKEMFKSHSLGEKKVQYCVKVDDTYIGVIDYSVQEERAVLSQLIIHLITKVTVMVQIRILHLKK